MKYYINAFKKATDIQSKASIKEFWYFMLINIIISIFIGVLKAAFGLNHIGTIYNIIIIIPFTTLGFRRLNEVGLSKWLFLIPFVNLILAGLPKEKK
ncbi:uncharacterized membrane protein YhaH (DUF805 family) [Oceanihabitans sediminis]|uniref:DUF805 domain-containing protein n=1 Tax=Oceanihabitans sediminis TaxID=1812012 RepID=A0A368P843_9FLAO|nr:DUF805 domain-containing protein [Oceanihabitans sediminis]RBP34616.1 uncharacterized membrane protein YhaH (DUF805 family) [Oceanihabitans sediminis]RCU58274.1 DUF805 domain-containing protein [Oceanihabitans sediminis]